MRCECGENFALLVRRHFGQIQATSKLSSDFVELRRRDLETAVRLFKTQMRLARLGGRELERPAGDTANPQGPLELETRQPAQAIRTPIPKRRILGVLPHDRVLDQRIAELIDDTGDGINAAKPVVQTLAGLRRGFQRQCHCHCYEE